MNELVRAARRVFGAAFCKSLLAAADGTGLEAGLSDDHGPWLRRAGSDGSIAYWIVCGLKGEPAHPWPVFLQVRFGLADNGPPDEFRSELVLELTLTGTCAGDPRVPADFAVRAVLNHERALTWRES
jgi:hypothetical protein